MHALWTVLALALPAAGADALHIAPSSAEQLQGVLEKLTKLPEQPPWCSSQCLTLLELRVAGSLQKGELSIDIQGVVSATEPTFAELLGSASSLGLSSAMVYGEGDRGGRSLPLFWSGTAYSAVLPPGPFTLHATARVKAGAALTLTVPGPAGHVHFAVSDADVEGSGRWRGVTDATYHITPQVHGTTTARPVSRLRLHIARAFSLSRDKRFTVTVQASGATPGQVIRVPLVSGEAVEDFDAHTGHLIGNERIDWVASSASPVITYAGRWTRDDIRLVAPTGATRETWEVRCDDPFECTFSGDAETWVGHPGHAWEPLAGQQLTVAVQQLVSQPGVHTVAQEVQILDSPTGTTLRQDMWVTWNSSTGSLVGVGLPPNAQISTLTLQDAPLPLLKDAHGALQVSVPQGSSVLHAQWQIPGLGGNVLGLGRVAPPMPVLSQPVAALYHRVELPVGRVALLAGGLSGSPRVTLWGNMAAVLLAAAAVLWLFRRLQMPLTAPVMWVVVALGYAIDTPAAVIPLALTLAMGRWLARLNHPKTRLWIAIDMVVWATLALAAVSITFDTLNHALFEAAPFEVEPFVSAPDIGQAPNVPLVWGTFLAGAANPTLPAPWAFTVPLILVRLVWAGWAVTLAFFLMGEGRLALAQLDAYWKTATAPTAGS